VSAAEEYARKRADLRLRPFEDLCGSIPADDIPAACLRVSAALTHVMHAHYMLLQWHRAPYDPRNNTNGEECEFLHRCAADDPAGDDDDTTATSAARTAAARAAFPLPPGVRPSPMADGAAFIDVLRQLRPFLLRGRAAVWQHMQQRFAALLLTAVGTAGVSIPMERLSQCLVAARDLMTVGMEYVGRGRGAGAAAGGSGAAEALLMDPCSNLRGSLRLLCSQYMDAVHAESMDRLRGMLVKEPWQPVPVTDQAMASVMESAVAGARTRYNKAAYAAIAAAASAIKGADVLVSGGDGGGGDIDALGANRTFSDGASVFACWLDRGNPFGWLVLLDGGKRGASVLPTPRVVVDDDDDDDDDEEDEEGLFAPTGARAARDETTEKLRAAAAAAAARRATARQMRHIHGDGYMLELGLGRGPSMGFATGGSGGDGGGGGGGGRDGDGSDDSDCNDDILESDSADSTSDDDDDEEEGAGKGKGKGSAVRSRRGVGGAGGAGGGDDFGSAAAAAGGSPAAVLLGGAHHHTVTSAALNGVARAVGRYVLLMEVLPTVAPDAFTGLARLFELYLFTVATLLLRVGALKALFDLEAPLPTPADRERERSINAFDFLDGSAYSIAARVTATAAEARTLVGKASGRGGGAPLRRGGSVGDGMGSPGGSGGGGGGGGGSSAGDDEGFAVGGAGGSRRPRGGATGGERSELDTVDLFGVTLFLRGLPAQAQAQGLPPDYYSMTGAGAAAGATMGGNAFNAEGVYVLLRRALQHVGSELAAGGVRGSGSGTSVLVDGEFGHDTGATTRGVLPPPFVRPAVPLDVESEANGWGVSERCVGLESLDFILDILARVRPRIEAQLPATHSQSIINFFTRAVMSVVQLRALMYHSLTVRLMPEVGVLPDQVAAPKWYVGGGEGVVPRHAAYTHCTPQQPPKSQKHAQGGSEGGDGGEWVCGRHHDGAGACGHHAEWTREGGHAARRVTPGRVERPRVAADGAVCGRHHAGEEVHRARPRPDDTGRGAHLCRRAAPGAHLAGAPVARQGVRGQLRVGVLL